ncbi:hypothetical protein ACFVYP_15385 [Kitasatospora sp. NPDC058201]|uniref:hypothetical protein n=1 Tax=unclassified Kitasatospora TaxID=2633591 RepID=UPI00364FC739
MEHEVVVPMPAGLVRQALQDPALLARSVPGLSTEPAAVGSGPADEIAGRLKLRIGTSTITYKGGLSLIEGREGVLTAFAEGQEARGSGEATATVRVSVADGAEDGTAVVRFTGDLTASGRLTEFDDETLAATGRRLLDRFAAALASPDGAPEVVPDEDEEAAVGADGAPGAAREPAAEDPGSPGDAEDGPVRPDGRGAGSPDTSEDDRADRADRPAQGTVDAEDGQDADDVEEPEDAEDVEDGGQDDEEPPGTATVVFLEDHQEDRQGEPGDDLDDDLSDLIAFSDADAERFGLPVGDVDEPDRTAAGAGAEEAVSADLPSELPFEYEQDPVLGGPVRRSIVGRSAEEVDHAPPRGPYAPALPARSARARAASRWGGDAGGIVVPGVGGRSAVPWVIGGGVALLGGAVVLVRALRRR